MSEERAIALALVYKAIDDLMEERSQANADFKARLETLTKQAHELRYEILSGQMRLIPTEEPPKSDAKSAGAND